MMSQLSCLSSQRLKKDVVDSFSSRRPSRRRHAVGAHEMKMVLQQSYFGGRPLPLPKPEDAAPMQQGQLYEGILSPFSKSFHDCNQQRLRSSQHDEEQLMIFASLTPCYPPPPVSSPTSSSGKCSPASAGAVVVWKPQQQEHPSPTPNNGDVATPPPPWSTSSEDAASSPPWSSPITLLPAGRSMRQFPTDLAQAVKVVALEEIERACNGEHEIIVTGRGESCVITGWVPGEEEEKLVAVVWQHRHSRQGWKEWAAKVKLISRVEDPHICKLQGYYGARGVDEQILVYDHNCRGSLSDYLFGSLCKTLLDWRSRVKIALEAARALACLHDLAPIEVVYNDFKSSNILLDLDFSVKLAGHGLDVITRLQVNDKLNKTSSAVLRRREASNKSNIRSYGVLLLELLTGKAIAGQDETLFTRWAKPFLKSKHGGQQQELQQLANILDPQLRRELPCPGLKKVAALTRHCLRMDSSKRPSISQVVDIMDCTAMQALLQPAHRCKSHHRRPTSNSSKSYYKCLSLRRLQPSDQTRFSRTLSNKHF